MEMMTSRQEIISVFIEVKWIAAAGLRLGRERRHGIAARQRLFQPAELSDFIFDAEANDAPEFAARLPSAGVPVPRHSSLSVNSAARLSSTGCPAKADPLMALRHLGLLVGQSVLCHHA
jgi:hypothetical protein